MIGRNRIRNVRYEWVEGANLSEYATKPVRGLLLRRGVTAGLGCGLLLAGLAGCESQFRQDPLLVQGATDATVFENAPIFIDRPLSENLVNSLIFKDYVTLLQRAGLLDVLRGPGPYTVFALVNPAIEGIPDIYRERMLAPQNAAGLRGLMSFTIVPGRFDVQSIIDLIRKGGGQASLKTIGGDLLGVRLDPTGQYLRLFDSRGRVSLLRLVDVAQSNGRLYAGSTLLAPN